MQSPSAEWSLTLGYVAALNLLRNAGAPDADTISELVRGVVNRTPHGDVLFSIVLAVGFVGFRKHILK